MSVVQTYLIEFSIGPVQGFIDAARRTSDLWRGSQILGDLSIGLVRHLTAQGCELIYPSQRAYQEVVHNGAESNVSNIVLVAYRASSDTQVRELSASARAHLTSELIGWGQEAIEQFRDCLRGDVSTRELEDYIEFFAAWSVVGKDGSLNGDGYRPAYDQVKSLLAARKNTRLFDPAMGAAGIPKSSLEGINNTVLKEKRPTGGKILQLRLSPGEQLDLVGLIKRAPKNREMFTAISRIAAHDWIENLAKRDPDLLQNLCEGSERLVSLGLVSRSNGNKGKYKSFAYDAQFLFRSRVEIARMEAAQGFDATASQALEEFFHLVHNAWSKHGEPEPYMAMLMADGDRVGELIDKASTAEQHQEISNALFDFSAEVPGLVRQFNGHCVYAGGDDVLALMPLGDVLQISRQLSELFSRKMAPVATKLGVQLSPTLSVGVAITHVLEPLGNIRQLAAQALQYAKGDHLSGKGLTELRRNALGLTVSPRSGSTEKLRIRWDDSISLDMLSRLTAGFQTGDIPSKFAYQTRAIGLEQKVACQRIHAKGKSSPQVQKQLELAAQKLAQNQWARRCSRSEFNKESLELRKRIYERGLAIGCEALARELIVSRWLAAKVVNRDMEASL